MLTAVLLDGPLAGEVLMAEGVPTLFFHVPKRVTVCDCNPLDAPVEFDKAAEVVEYHAVMVGFGSLRPKVAFYSCRRDEDAVLMALKSWVHTNLDSPVLRYGCRDARAFT